MVVQDVLDRRDAGRPISRIKGQHGRDHLSQRLWQGRAKRANWWQMKGRVRRIVACQQEIKCRAQAVDIAAGRRLGFAILFRSSKAWRTERSCIPGLARLKT